MATGFGNYAFGIPRLGDKPFCSPARPGKFAVRGQAAGPVSSVNGQKAKPGWAEKVPARSRGGKGSIARPGGAQKIRG